MRLFGKLILWLSLCAAVPALAQPGIIRLDAKPRPFTHADFETLVACTLEKHPDSTKRAATYFYQRRDNQTPQENKLDPDSDTFSPSLEGCISLANGEPFPFSPDALVHRWASAHKISRQVP